MQEKRIEWPEEGCRAETVVLADGDYPSREFALGLLERCGYVVCCDGVADEYIGRGGMPAAIVGDLDSLSAAVRAEYADRIYRDGDQEYNDLTKAVRYCVSQGRRDITILGATGRREDHTIGNISLLADYMDVARVRMVSDHAVITPVDAGRTVFGSFPGQQVTILTFDPRTLVTTESLRYPLREAGLRLWWQATLNEALDDSFALELTGKAVVLQSFEPKSR